VFSVPIIVWGSKLVMKLMDRYPITIVIGAALLGWIAGDMAVTDVVTMAWVDQNAVYLHWLMPVLIAGFVVIVGKRIAARAQVHIRPVIDLVEESELHQKKDK
jgi:predicted tellurium resistance membrane protein TerC